MVDASDLKFYHSDVGDDRGGDISGNLTEVISGNSNNLFSNVTRAQQVAGSDVYQCMYIKNTSDETMKNVNWWMTVDTAYGDVKWAREANPDKYRYAPYMSFNGSSDFVEQSHSSSLDLFQFTVAAWFKTSTSYVTSGAIVNKGGFGSESAGENMNYGIWITASNTIQAGFETTAGTDRFVTSPSTYNDGTWHFAVVTYNGTTLNLYIDGNQTPVDTLATTDTPETNAKPLRIGKNSRADNQYFSGRIDEVRVWDDNISSQEMADLYNNGDIPDVDDIVYENKFGNDNGTVLAQTIATTTTEPTGLNWHYVESQPVITLGTLKPEGYKPIWFWWHIPANEQDAQDARALFNFTFDITTTGTGSSGGSGGGGGTGSGGNPPPPVEDFKIAVAGDWGCEDVTDDVVNQIIDNDYDVVIGVGDNSYAGSASCWIDSVATPLFDADITFHSAYGNHEYSESAGTGPYKDLFGHSKTYYTRDFRNIHFIVMDTNIDSDPGSAQHDFVTADLEAQDNRSNIDWIFVVMHQAMVGTNSDNGVNEFDQVENYMDLFLEHNVTMVLSGHNHIWERTYPVKRNGSSASRVITTTGPYTVGNPDNWLIQVVSGAGGHDSPNGSGADGELYSVSNPPSYSAYQSNDHNGIFSIEVSDNGQTLTCRFIETGGDTEHSFVINNS